MYTELYNLEFKRLDLIKQFIRIQYGYYNLTKDLQEQRQNLYIEFFKVQGKVAMLKQYKDNNQVLPVDTFDRLALNQDETIDSKIKDFTEMMQDVNNTFNDFNFDTNDEVVSKQFYQMILDKIYLNNQYKEAMDDATFHYLLNDVTELKNLYFDISNVMPIKVSLNIQEEKKEGLIKEIAFLEKNYPEEEEDAIYDANKLEEEKKKLKQEIEMVQDLINKAYEAIDDYESAGEA